MAKCKFCKDLEWLKDKSKDIKKKDGMNTYYKAALEYRRVLNGVTHGIGNFDTYPLYFCPVCGTKLVKAIRQKKKL